MIAKDDRLTGGPLLSAAMMRLGDLWRNEEDYVAAQRQFIGGAIEYHLSHNDAYRRYCNRLGFDSWVTMSDVTDIPVMPSAFFKRAEFNMSTVPDEVIVKRCVSSGTRGGLSVVPRDDETLTAFLGSMSAVVSELFGIDRTGNHVALVLGPDPSEAADLWISYVFSTMTLSFVTKYLERGGEYDPNEALLELEATASSGTPVMLVGPPFRIAELAGLAVELGRPFALAPDSFVLSAGGWKGRQREAIDRVEYQRVVSGAFRVADSAVRDVFNMVELNSVISECEFHEKHVVPWVDVVARNPRTNEVLPEGQLGILSYCDGSAVSYPCFVLGEDFGSVVSGRCACGRVGKRMRMVRRLDGIEARGCALKMATGANDGGEMDVSTRFFKSYFRSPEAYGLLRGGKASSSGAEGQGCGPDPAERGTP